MMPIMKHLLLTYFVTLSIFSSGQSINFSELSGKGDLKSSGHLTKDDKVMGYYFYFFNDRKSKTIGEYTMCITNLNLEIVREITIEQGLKTVLGEVVFNGTHFGIAFINAKDHRFEMFIYSNDGAFVRTKFITIPKMEFIKKQRVYFSDKSSLFAVENKGFLLCYERFLDRFTKEEFQYVGIDSTEDKILDLQLDKFNVTYEIVKVDKSYLNIINKYWSNTVGAARNFEYDRINLETGKLEAKVQLEDKEFTFRPRFLSYNDEQKKVILYGDYFKENSKVENDKPLGYSRWILQDKRIENKKFLDLDTEAGKFVDVNSNGKIDDVGYIFAEDFIELANGEVYLIGEGVASSGKTLKIRDLVAIKFNKDFEMQDVKIFEKEMRSLTRGNSETIAFYSAYSLANYFKKNLDYCYSQKSSDGNSFIFYYLDFITEKGYRGFTVNAIINQNGEFKVEKAKWSRDVHFRGYLKSKFGSILILDYNRRDKNLSAHIENYIL